MQKLRIGTGAVTAEIWTLGAALNGVWAPDRDGNLAQVVLGHADEAERLESTAYLGRSSVHTGTASATRGSASRASRTSSSAASSASTRCTQAQPASTVRSGLLPRPTPTMYG